MEELNEWDLLYKKEEELRGKNLNTCYKQIIIWYIPCFNENRKISIIINNINNNQITQNILNGIDLKNKKRFKMKMKINLYKSCKLLINVYFEIKKIVLIQMVI